MHNAKKESRVELLNEEVILTREREASAMKKLITASLDGFKLLNRARFRTFHKLNKVTKKRAPRPFLALRQELGGRELYLKEAETVEWALKLPRSSN